jgi:hypothetical protein
MTDWTTRIEPQHSRRFGVEEIHNVWFLPKNWPGKGPTVGLLIPECEMQVCLPTADGEPIIMVNRPPTNKQVRRWLRSACEYAVGWQAALFFGCDTPKQAALAAKQAIKLLPATYERMALERFYEAKARSRGGLQ